MRGGEVDGITCWINLLFFDVVDVYIPVSKPVFELITNFVELFDEKRSLALLSLSLS